MAIYKHGRGVELWATEKQLQLAVRAGLEPGTSGFQVRHPNPLDYAASLHHHRPHYHRHHKLLMMMVMMMMMRRRRKGIYWC